MQALNFFEQGITITSLSLPVPLSPSLRTPGSNIMTCAVWRTIANI